jgi:hypothetical protein
MISSPNEVHGTLVKKQTGEAISPAIAQQSKGIISCVTPSAVEGLFQQTKNFLIKTKPPIPQKVTTKKLQPTTYNSQQFITFASRF